MQSSGVTDSPPRKLSEKKEIEKYGQAQDAARVIVQVSPQKKGAFPCPCVCIRVGASPALRWERLSVTDYAKLPCGVRNGVSSEKPSRRNRRTSRIDRNKDTERSDGTSRTHRRRF